MLGIIVKGGDNSGHPFSKYVPEGIAVPKVAVQGKKLILYVTDFARK